MVLQQQLRRVKDCKALAGEYVTTQHNPVVFKARIKKWKEKRTMGPTNINTEEMAKAVGEKRGAWKMIEGIIDLGEQPPTSLGHLCGQKKKAARRAVDRARRSMEEELYRKLDEDGGKR